MAGDRPPVGRGNVFLGPTDELPGEVIPEALRRKLGNRLPSVNRPRRGLTWMYLKRAKRALVVRTHVVTWEPLRIAWLVAERPNMRDVRRSPLWSKMPPEQRAAMSSKMQLRKLGVFPSWEQAIGFALVELGGAFGELTVK